MSQKSTKSEEEFNADRIEKARELVQSMNIVKKIITIIMALAFTNAIIQFFINPSVYGTYEGKNVSEFGIIDVWILCLIITTIIRFYHGNSIHLNNIYKIKVILKNGIYSPPYMEAFFLVLESFIFALMSVYQFNIKYLFCLFVVLFSIDIILFFSLICMKFKKLINLIRDETQSTRGLCKTLDNLINVAETNWTIVNTATVIILLILWGIWKDDLFVDYAHCFLIVVTANLILDYSLNWKFYFPSIPKT